MFLPVSTSQLVAIPLPCGVLLRRDVPPHCGQSPGLTFMPATCCTTSAVASKPGSAFAEPFAVGALVVCGGSEVRAAVGVVRPTADARTIADTANHVIFQD